MATINFQINRPPAKSIKGLQVLEQPYSLFPKMVKDSYEKSREKFKKYGYTVETLKRHNTLERKYYGYTGQDWVLVGTMLGAPGSKNLRYASK